MTQDERDLRDYLAGLAMQALISKMPAITLEGDGEDDPAASVAIGAYDYAEAMLCERFERDAADDLEELEMYGLNEDSLEHSIHCAVHDTKASTGPTAEEPTI